MELLRLHHVQLAMPEGGEGKARAFYADAVGFSEVAKPAALAQRGGVWFEHAQVRLHLGVEQGFRPAKKAHPALQVDDAGTFAERLTEAGYAIVWDGNLPGFKRFYVDDPFGNRIEILEQHA